MLQRSHGVCLLAVLAFAHTSAVHAQAVRSDTTTLDVIVEGLPDALTDKISAFLSIDQQKSDRSLTEEKLRLLHKKAPQEIRGALEPIGYYHARVHSELTHDGDQWVARYVVDAGAPMRIESVDIRVFSAGANDPEFVKLQDALPLRKDSVLRHADYEKSKSLLLNLAAERGYFDAKLLVNELRIDLTRNAATAVLHIDTGRRYRFGDVRFQQTFFDREYLGRFVPFKPGDPYSNAALLQLQTALNSTDYFQQVDVQPRRDQARDVDIPIDVVLTRRPPNKYTAGIGYGTDTGVRGKLGWERRIINPTGDHFIAELDASQISKTINTRYLIPVLDPRTDQVFIGASSGTQETLTSTSNLSSLGTGLNYTRGKWQYSLALNYQYERFTAGSDNGLAHLLIPTISLTRIDADSRTNPRRGGRAQIELRGANDAVASDLSFWTMRLGGKYIFPIGEDGRIVTRADAGYTVTPNFHELPASLRFYTGGAQSVRGYSYQALGSTDSSGQVIGGRYLLVGSVEYEYRITDMIGAATFFDTGKAFNDGHEPFDQGAGVGVRLHLPLGLIQLDAAQALTREGHPWRVHFAIGAEL